MMKFTLLLTFIIMLPCISPAQQDIGSMADKTKIIAIPASDKSINALMDQNFSRCSFFCFYNTKTDSITFVENKYLSASGGASNLVIQFLAANKVNEIYAVQVGRKAKMNLDRLKIRINIISSGKTIRQIINSIKN